MKQRIFTFHNVSINTKIDNMVSDGSFYLHSTMFLLILRCHYHLLVPHTHLHSTMFLLIPEVEESDTSVC